MKTIFENNRVVIIGDNGDFKVTVKTSNGAALHSLAAEIDRLQNEITKAQLMVTLEHTSEPDLRHYHFYTEHQKSSLAFSGSFSVTVAEQDSFNPSDLMRQIKEQTCKLAYENDNINSEPEDWAIKSISRL